MAEGINYPIARRISTKLQQKTVREIAIEVTFCDEDGAARAVETVVESALFYMPALGCNILESAFTIPAWQNECLVGGGSVHID